MMLAGREDIDGEMGGFGEIREQRGIAREAPEYQRRIERDRGERVYSEAYAAAVFCARGNYRYAGGVLAQGATEIAGIELCGGSGLRSGLVFHAAPIPARRNRMGATIGAAKAAEWSRVLTFTKRIPSL
jgi:hypothetical protein